MIYRETAIVTRNTKIANDIYLTGFHLPSIAREAHPGQFVNLAPLADGSILNRPMAIYDTDAGAGTVAIGYHTIGANTNKYAEMTEGDELVLTGPLGVRFDFDRPFDHYFLVGGGIGITSLHLVGKYLAMQGKQVSTLIGARTKNFIACRDDFAKFGEVKIATDDGSVGYHGFIHHLLDQILSTLCDNPPQTPPLQGGDREGGRKTQVIYCGPPAMMKACAVTCTAHKIAHLAVMEEMMACGVGICVACVCQTGEGQKKVCIDGPVFVGSKIQWTREQTSGMHE